ncbi:MAG: Hsp70 family protein, partial [Spirochaetota bacterium]
ESLKVEEDLSLGRFLLAGLKPAKSGAPRISVDFSIDESDILQVSARDLETGAAQAITIVDLDRGADGESAEVIVAKTRRLAERLGELLAGTRIDGSLETEIRNAMSRGQAAIATEGEGKLRILRAELEGLVGELLSRGLREAPSKGTGLSSTPVPQTKAQGMAKPVRGKRPKGGTP